MSVHHLLKISRLEGLTDGVFAIAMTILVLDLRLPSHLPVENLLPILQQDIFIKLLIYIGSFVILGTQWVAMNFQLGLLECLNRQYLWANIFYLMVVCVVPFSANLLGAYPNSSASIAFYAVNLPFACGCQLLIFGCACIYKLNKDTFTPALRAAVIKHTFVAPIFYVVALLVAHWSTTIAFILLVAPTLIYMRPGSVDQFEHS